MKRNEMELKRNNSGNETGFKDACVASCRMILGQIKRARETILVESSLRFKMPDRMLRLALNEAEALSWQTLYPQLVFPTLAAEKVQAIALWNIRQKNLKRSGPAFEL